MRFPFNRKQLRLLLLLLLAVFVAPSLFAQRKVYVYGSDTFNTVNEACQAFIKYEYSRDDSLSRLQSGPKDSHTGTPVQQSATKFGVKVVYVQKFEKDSRQETKVIDSVFEMVTLPGPASKDSDTLVRKIKKFPTGSYVLEQAKLYQAKFSSNADSSYELRKVSFDAVKGNTLIDAKYGHGKSLFEEETYDVTNLNRATKLIDQARRQRTAIEGTDYNVEWHVSTQLGADGLSKLFRDNAIDWITVIFTPL